MGLGQDKQQHPAMHAGGVTKQKKSFFLADFALQNMLETTLPDGL